MTCPQPSAILAFSHLNLRWNPFGEPSQDERGELAVAEDIVPAGLVQIIGEEGAGKSTRLLALLTRHPNALYEYVPEGHTKFVSKPAPSDVFLLDEAQRVRPWRLRRLLAHRTVIMGTHEDLSHLTKRPVRTIHLQPPTPEQLLEIFSRRIAWARRGPGPLPEISRATVEHLHRQYGANVRAMEAELYDLIQTACSIQLSSEPARFKRLLL